MDTLELLRMDKVPRYVRKIQGVYKARLRTEYCKDDIDEQDRENLIGSELSSASNQKIIEFKK